jgi:drug/metabolite transporter (DMT)-like permease
MALMSWADLSYVLPVTSLGYVASAIIGRFFLSEQITPVRWAGTILIVAGTVLVGRGSPHSKTEV